MTQPFTPRLGEYELRREIGRGGMGVVYEAWHPRLGRRVAVKTFVFGPSVTAKERARFDVEVQAAARLQHPAIATVFEAGEADGRPFYAMEFVDGSSLVVALRDGPWEVRKAAILIRDAAIAVGYAHQQDVLHRDLKPGNILLDADGHPKIVDFGLAKCLDSDTDLTRTGQIMGTPAYMAPEQALGLVKSSGPGVDIYALGTILYELLTGRPPFQGPDPIQTLSLVATADPIPPRTLQPSVPRDLEVICLKCLHKSANRRYATAEELADDLNRFLNGQAILARPVGWLERTWKWMKRRPALTSLIASAVVFVIALFIAFLQIRSALEEAEQNLALFHAAVEKLSVDLADNLSEIPEAEGIRAELLESARELYDTLAKMRPRDNNGRFLMAATLDNLGRISRQLGRSDEARSAFNRSLEEFDILLESDPDNHEYLMGAAAVHNNLSEMAPDTEGKIRELELALNLMPAPDSDDDRRQRGATLNNLALGYLRRQEFDKAEDLQQQALEIRGKLHADHPDELQYTVDLAVSHNGLAQIHYAREDFPSAHEEYQRADAVLAEVESTLDREGRYTWARIRSSWATCLEVMGDLDGALSRYADAAAIAADLSRDFPRYPDYRIMQVRLETFQADVLGQQGDVDAALAHVRLARDLVAPLAEAGHAEATELHAQCVSTLEAFEEPASPTEGASDMLPATPCP